MKSYVTYLNYPNPGREYLFTVEYSIKIKTIKTTKTIKTIKTIKKMKTIKKISTIQLFLLSIIIILSGCSKDNPDPTINGNYENGYFITNEGNFGSANGSISYVDEYGSATNDVFLSNNSFPLGDVVQSMSIINKNAYIVVNNSSKIEVAYK